MLEVGQPAYLGLFAAATVGCLFAALQTRSFSDPELRRSLGAFLGLTGVWGATSFGQLVFLGGPIARVLFIIGLIVGLGTVIVWLWFCSVYAGYTYHRNRRLQAGVLGLYTLIVIVKITNPLHEAYYTLSGGSGSLAPEFTALYWVVTGLAYFGAALGLYMLFDLYASSRFDTTKVAVLTLAAGLPIIPTLVVALWPDLLLPLYYEPVGVAIFGVGVVAVVRDTFVSIRGPARRQLADYLGDAVIIVNSNDEIVDYNQSAKELFPDIETAIGTSVKEALHLSEKTVESDIDATVLQMTIAGRRRHYQLRQPEITLGDRSVGEAIVLSDVTQLETQRRKLRQQTEHMDSLTEAMAHELRNPLTIVLGQLERLESELDDPAQETSLEIVREETSRMEAIIDDLILVIDSSKPITDTQTYPLAALIEEAWEGGKTPCTLQVDLERSLAVVADYQRARELFERIFVVHRERGATKVTVSRKDRQLIIESDGEPFATQHVDALFEYGVEAGEEEGLALAHARTLANLHGWQATADVEAATGPRILLKNVTMRGSPAAEAPVDQR